jgi:hypothetical protein
MSANFRLIGLFVSAMYLPLNVAAANTTPAKTATPAKGPVLAAGATRASCRPAPHRLAAHHQRYRFAARGHARPRGPNPMTAALNRNQLRLSSTVMADVSSAASYQAQLGAYRDANARAASDYQAQVDAWRTAVFTGTPPGYHVELANAPPGYHLEPIAPPGYHVEPISAP